MILAILYKLPQNLLYKLQQLQNAAARIVTLSTKRTHITPVLQSLHWLPVKDRIIFKILLLTFHCVHGSAPLYNVSLIQNYTPVRSLRSSTSGSLVIPRVSRIWGERSFAHACPMLWNNLPDHIKTCVTSDSFKNHVKTFQFNP